MGLCIFEGTLFKKNQKDKHLLLGSPQIDNYIWWTSVPSLGGGARISEREVDSPPLPNTAWASLHLSPDPHLPLPSSGRIKPRTATYNDQAEVNSGDIPSIVDSRVSDETLPNLPGETIKAKTKR